VLFSLCCQVQKAVQSQPRSMAACAVFGALDAFFRKAAQEQAFGHAHSVVDSSSTTTDSSSAISLVPGMKAEAEQSGLMDAFKTAMTAAAKHLQHPCLQQKPTPAFADYFPILYLCGSLTKGWPQVCQLWPEGRERLAAIAIAAPAAVQLSAAIMQLVSRDLPAAVKAAPEAPSIILTMPACDGTQPVQDPPEARSYASDLCWAVFEVQLVMCWLNECIVDVDTDDPYSLPEVRPWAAAPEFASVLATLLVVTSEALLAQQQTAPATATASTPSTVGGSSSSHCQAGKSSSSTNSSTNGSPGSSTGSDSRTAATNSAASRGKVVDRWLEEAIKNLPECTKALLETLGMDSTAVVWAAAAQRDQARFGILHDLTLAFSFLMHCLSPPAAGVITLMSPTCEQALRQQLLLLVSATLLRWASNTRATTHDRMQQCVMIARYAGDIIHYWLRSSKVVVAELPSDTGSNHHACGPWLQPYFPAAWLEQVLPDIQKLLAVLLQQPCRAPALTSAGKLVAEAPGHLVLLQCYIIPDAPAVGRDEKLEVPSVGSGSDVCTSRHVQGADEQEVLSTAVQPLAEFRSVTVQTLASLEGFIRASAQQLAAGSMPDSIAQKAFNAITAALVSNVPIASDGHTQMGPLLCLVDAAGPGSPEQQQLYSLMSSLVKLSALGPSSSDAQLSVISVLTAWAALELLKPPQDSEGCNSSSNAKQHSPGPPKPGQAATGSSTAPATAASAVTVTLLPILVLFGRCCLIWAQQLQQAVPEQNLEHRSFTPFVDVLLWLCFGAIQDTAGSTTTACNRIVSQALSWLTAPAVAQQLAAAGYQTQQLSQLCQELSSACMTAAEAWQPSEDLTEATAMALVQQLQVTGSALAGLAVPTMCCNPSCSNITGPLDLQLVSGRSCLCGGCRTARYCSRACQKAAWKLHKPACSALAAAAEPAPVPQAAG